MVIDELDRALLKHLLDDARLSHRELARRAGSTAPTVAARLRRMEELGIIHGYQVVLDASRFGADAPAPPHPDLAAPVTVACHTCKKATLEPIIERIGGRLHPFCCTTCCGQYRAKHQDLQKGL